MIDAKQLRSDTDGIRAALARRGAGELVEDFLKLDEEHRRLLTEVEHVRADRNAAAKSIAEAKQRGDDTSVPIAKQSALKAQQAEEEQRLAEVQQRMAEVMMQMPNVPDPTAADGMSEEDAETVRVYGEPPKFGFPPKDHFDLAGPEGLGLIDTESAARVSGSRFHYLLGDLVRLEFALMQWGLDKLLRRGFTPVIPPVLVREEAMVGTGFFPEAREQVYEIPRDELFLVGTAEVPLASLHAGRMFETAELPLRYVGFSTCFRREAGAAGRDTRGIFRVHQFDKLEMFVFCHPEASQEEHDGILAIEEEIAQELGFHYRVQNIAVGDLGAPASKKYDIEVWLPGQQRYRELTSCSNTTDFQARRLDVRYRTEKGPRHVHMLNGTAATSSRTLLALVEYGQQEDGSIRLPEVLQPFGAPPTISRSLVD
ncbi:MAG: seryl-tRNA synthetase [Gaiellales bacterium]|jgi:seryl-tRNA synthetase|nr:seryl-tRNA synthetase [Gaiellales bacterium]